MTADLVQDLREAQAALARVRAICDTEDARVTEHNDRLTAERGLNDDDPTGKGRWVVLGILSTREVRAAIEGTTP